MALEFDSCTRERNRSPARKSWITFAQKCHHPFCIRGVHRNEFRKGCSNNGTADTHLPLTGGPPHHLERSRLLSDCDARELDDDMGGREVGARTCEKTYVNSGQFVGERASELLRKAMPAVGLANSLLSPWKCGGRIVSNR